MTTFGNAYWNNVTDNKYKSIISCDTKSYEAIKEKLENYINQKGNDLAREYYNNEIRGQKGISEHKNNIFKKMINSLFV